MPAGGSAMSAAKPNCATVATRRGSGNAAPKSSHPSAVASHCSGLMANFIPLALLFQDAIEVGLHIFRDVVQRLLGGLLAVQGVRDLIGKLAHIVVFRRRHGAMVHR